MRTNLLITIVLSIVAFSGCARQIPNKVTADEYAVYSAWATGHFVKNPPQQLYFSSRTGVFDPLADPWKSCLQKDGASESQMKQLHVLGDAQYALDFYQSSNLQIPWSYKEVDRVPDLEPGTFRLITFSRVAFTRDHSGALFAFFDACAAGECGSGGYVQGQKQGGKWIFHNLSGCVELS